MKSLNATLNEAIEKMTPKQRDKFYQSRKVSDAVEVQLNCAERIVAGTVKETAPITKRNGAGDNGREVFTESTIALSTREFKEVERQRSDDVLFEALRYSETDKRKLRNLPPVGSPNLTANQLREYRFFRDIRFSEADALKAALLVS